MEHKKKESMGHKKESMGHKKETMGHKKETMKDKDSFKPANLSTKPKDSFKNIEGLEKQTNTRTYDHSRCSSRKYEKNSTYAYTS